MLKQITKDKRNTIAVILTLTILLIATWITLVGGLPYFFSSPNKIGHFSNGSMRSESAISSILHSLKNKSPEDAPIITVTTRFVEMDMNAPLESHIEWIKIE